MAIKSMKADTFNGTIIISARNLKGEFNNDLFCILLNAQEHLNKDTNLLFYNSAIRDEFGIPTTENRSIRGPMCPNDGEEVQFWKEEYFEMEYFIVHLDQLDSDVKYIDFLLCDYEKLNGIPNDICAKNLQNYKIEIFKIENQFDILGKNTVISENPTFEDYIPTNIMCPHCRIGRLQKADVGWEYVPIMERIRDFEEKIQNYLV